MVRITHAGNVVNGKQYLEFAGVSGDEKPISGISTGSLFHEVDTKKVYAYNENADSGSEWVEQMTLSEE